MRSAPRKPLGRPKGSSSEETRARILAAARTAFSTTGYASTTNQQIAALADVTAAAIYQYFDSKMALYLATVKAATAALLDSYRGAVASATTARGALRAMLLDSAQIHASDPSLAAFLSALPVEMRRHPELTLAMIEPPNNEVLSIFEHAVQLGVRSGEIARSDAPKLVSLFVACTMGLSLYAAAIPGTSLTQVIETFVALLDGELWKKPAHGGGAARARPRQSARRAPRKKV